MTPIEKKAEEIAEELINEFSKVKNITFIIIKKDIKEDIAKKCAIISVNNTIEALSSIKGMGKIQKVKLYKLVKEKLEAK